MDTAIYFKNDFIPGKTYFIRVINPLATINTRSFTICVQSYPPPVNDVCAAAVQLTPNTACVTTSGTLSGAMMNGAVPGCAPNTSQDVWYKFTATEQTMSVTASIISGSSMYIGFEIIEDSCSGPVFRCVNEMDTAVYFKNDFIPGKTYFIRVINPYSTINTRSVTICVRSYPSPANDICSNAIQLMPNAACVNTTGNFSGATMDVGIPGCAANTSQDVWYKFVATSSNMGIQLAAVNGLNHGFQVVEGSCNGTVISCINNNGTGLSESVNLTALTVGTTYFVRVINASATINTGNFSICLTGPPPAACTPSVAITASTVSICFGTTVVFNATPTYGGTSPSYQWKVNGNNVGTNSPSYTTTTLTDGSTISCVMTSNAVCAFPATVTSNVVNIAVSGLITPGFTQIPAVCSGQSFSLPSSSDNGITGIWTPALNTTATTTYTFTPDSGQCASTTTMTVTVNNVTPAFTQISAVCLGQSFALPTTSNNGIIGAWSPAINNTATTTYTFTPNAGQCASTVTMTVAVNTGNVVPTFTQVAPVCPGQTFVLPAASNNGITGTWSPGVNNTATTTYTFTPNAGQCTSTTTMTVTVNTNSVLPAFSQVAAICPGQTFVLPAASNNGITGTWSPGVNNTTTTTYTFTPNAGQCASTTTMTVTVNTNSVLPAFSQVAAICPGQTFVLPSISNNGITGTWSPGVNNSATTTYTFTPNAGQCASEVTMTVTVNTGNVVPAFTQVEAICSGQIFVLPTTSNNGVTGTWSPAVNTMATTIYTFTPNTGQCASTTTMTVAVNNSTLPTFTQVAAICSGQSFTLPATSNNGISGTWSPAINNTITKTYTFTPNVGQCASTTTMTVTVNASNSIIPVFTQVAPICAGQSFTLPTTSNNGINGAWSPAINSNITLTYTFIPNNGQCAAMATMKVIVNEKVIPTFTQVMPICSGQSFTLPTVSNNGISGTWSPAINNTATKIYTFTPASGECAQTTTMLVIVNSVNAEVKTEGNTLIATATNATYQWVNCADNQPISGETNASFTPTAVGSYAVAVTQNGCSETSDCITITELGVDTFTRNGWNIYPNPATDQLFIDLNEATEIIIVDMTGKTIQRETLKSGNNIVNVNYLSSGVYIIKSKSGANVKFVKK
jgi:hypothetical protein